MRIFRGGFMVTMKRGTGHILALLASFIFAFMSCSDESCIIRRETGEAVQVTFRIAAGGKSALTRAITEDEVPGSGYENYIDVNKDSLHIMFFSNGEKDEESKFVEVFTPESVIPVDDSEYPQLWELRGPIVDPPVKGFKIVVLANCSVNDLQLEPGVTTIRDLCINAGKSFPLSIDGSGKKVTQLPQKVNIPMYGVKTIGSLDLKPNLNNDLGTIDLLRSVAKIVVRAEDAVTSIAELESVTLARFNRRIACAPLDMYDDTKNLNWDSDVHLYGDLIGNNGNVSNDTGSEAENLSFIPSEDKKVWTAYIPEYRNVDCQTNEDGKKKIERDDATFIVVKFKDVGKVYELYFHDYECVEGQEEPFNIVRNHIYQYNITELEGVYDLNVTLVAKPWDVRTFEIDYSNTVGVADDGKIRWEDTNHTLLEGHKVVASNAGNLQCTFKISSPVGAEWHAVLELTSGDPDHFRFVDGTGNKSGSLSGIVDGKPVTLTIAQSPEGVGTARLVIYARYGNVNFETSSVLGGPYILIKD